MINIRILEPSELDHARALIRKIFPQAMVHITDHDTILLAEQGNKPVGFAHLHEREDHVVFHGLGVDPGARGNGVGTLLMDSVMELSETTYKPIYLKVKLMNPAINLYARYGFFVKKFKGNALVLVNKANT